MQGDGGPIQPRSGIGARFVLVAALGLVPAVGIFAYWLGAQRQQASVEVEEWTRQTAGEVASQHARFLLEVQRTLEVLTVSRAIDDEQRPACSTVLREARQHAEWLGDVWVVDLSSRMSCAADPGETVPDLDADDYGDLARSGFAVTEVRAGRDGRSHNFVAAVRFHSESDGHDHLIVARVDVRWVAAATKPSRPQAGSVIVGLDEDDRVMFHSGGRADLIGKPLPSENVLDRLVDSGGAPIAASLGDGVDRLVSSAPVDGWGSTIVVGVDRDTIIATSRRDLIIGLVVLFGVLLVTGGVTWMLANRLILKPVRAVHDAAVSMARGNFGRRAGADRGPREIRELARAFNSMADRLEALALRDQLTNLPNRRYLDVSLAALVENGRPFGVLAVDLDGFKPINDRFGHAAGDAVLCLVAERLSQCAASDGFCTRVGGDEFMVVLTRSDSAALGLRAMAVGERVLTDLSAPFHLGDAEVSVSASIGAAIWRAGPGDVEDILHDADRALYAAKAAGRNRLIIFDGSQPRVPVRPQVRKSSSVA